MNAFKQLQMLGFKSFADKIELNFEGGITAIVGPNGCGKSNVADAIRWVLGEQSSKTLRGKTMQDVIFAGTEKRKKLSYCEVTLVFDNTQKWFSLEYDEISITRKLYRSGESEYYINKKPCRLKDIVDILYDSGIGKEGYSIIGQGQIDDIISSKPEDRRAIFEEAAGISKFKARKIESERRLERTRDNMTRLRDIIIEIERQIGPLKEQSENAKTYLQYKESLKNLEINCYLYQHENAKAAKNDIIYKMNGLQEELANKESHLSSLQQEYDNNMGQINEIDRTISNIRDDILQFTVRLEKKQGEQNLLSERLSHLKEQADRTRDMLAKYEAELSQRNMLLEVILEKKADEQKNLNILKNQENQINSKYLEILDTLTTAEGEQETEQRNMFQNLTRLAEIKASASGLSARREALTQNKTAEEKNLQLLVRSLESNQKYLNENNARIITCENKINDTQKLLDGNIVNLQTYETELASTTSKYIESTGMLNSVESKINLLKSLQVEYEGYAYAVKRLLKDSASNMSLKNNIMGVVGNIISVPEKYQTAIEMALGSSIQNIITADEEKAKNLVAYLKEKNAGRATFLPLSAMKTREMPYEYNSIKNHKGCLGIASELIGFDKKYQKAIESLLKNTAIADTLDNAVEIAKLSKYAFRIVTLDGDILSPMGAMTGGSKKQNETSILGKDTEIKNLQAESAALTRDVKMLSEKQKMLIEKKQRLTDEVTNIQNQLGSLKIELTSLESIKNNLLEKQNQTQQDIKSKQNFIEQADIAIGEIDAQINNLDTPTGASFEETDEHITARQSAFAQLKAKREKYNAETTNIKIKIAESEEKIRNYSLQLDNLNMEIETNKLLIVQAKKDSAQQLSIYNTAFAMQTETLNDEQSVNLKNLLKKAEEKLKNIDVHKTEILQEIKSLDEQKTITQNELAKLQNKVVLEEAKMQKFDSDIENLQNRIFEEYSYVYEDCLKLRDKDYVHRTATAEINRLKLKINALGAVNVAAIEDYKTVGARYETLTSQMEDLTKAEADLVTVIKELSYEMTTKFNAEFEKINQNFTIVFNELFGGGNAKLELLESDDPLNAGVDIIAEPPGKKLQNISLLSGGEKALTAIAILFAILKLKAMPFCLLDEIEAALDDANVERFAKYLNRFSQSTQFIVITHRKPTMEYAHSLYGITMEEKGVSKTVSVLLSDIADDKKVV